MRVLVGWSVLLFVDESIGNLDSVIGEMILDLFGRLYEWGAIIVVITHERDVAVRFPRQIMLRDGRVVSDAITAERVP